MPTYRLKEEFKGQDRVLPGIGRTVNGVITTDAKIESTLFELVPDSTAPSPASPESPAPAPSASSASSPAVAAPQVGQPQPQPPSEQTANKETI